MARINPPVRSAPIMNIVNVKWGGSLIGFVVHGRKLGAPPRGGSGSEEAPPPPPTTQGVSAIRYDKDVMQQATMNGLSGGMIVEQVIGPVEDLEFFNIFYQDAAASGTIDKDKNSILGYQMNLLSHGPDAIVPGDLVGKYGSSGDLLWKWKITTTNIIVALQVCCDNEGNIFVLSSDNDGTFEAVVTNHLTKLSPAGAVIWQKDFVSAEPTFQTVACASDGRSFLSTFSAGEVAITAYNPNGVELWTASGSGGGYRRTPIDSVLVALNADFTNISKMSTVDGSLIWTQSVVGANDYDMASNGDIFVLIVDPDDTLFSVRCLASEGGATKYEVEVYPLVGDNDGVAGFVVTGDLFVLGVYTQFHLDDDIGNVVDYSVKVFSKADGSLLETISWGRFYYDSLYLGIDKIFGIGRP